MQVEEEHIGAAILQAGDRLINVHLADSNRRALREITCRKELRFIPEIGSDYAASNGIAACISAATTWFIHFFSNRPPG